MKSPIAGAVLASLLLVPVAGQQADTDVIWRIRREATEHSRIERTVHMLTDRYGPRLTGSPNLRAASDWVVTQLTEWGLERAHLEPWDFGHPGWSNQRMTAHLMAPINDVLTAEVLAWTPGTDGAVRGAVVHVIPPENPTREGLDALLSGLRETVRGKAVLVGEPENLPVEFNAVQKRRDLAELQSEFDVAVPDEPAPSPEPDADDDGRLSAREVDEAIDLLLSQAGALVRLDDAGRRHGQIRAFSNRTYDPTLAPPTLVLRHEDFGRIARLLADGPVEVEVEIVNSVHPEGTTQYNVVAEIPGTDLAREVVMLGGHLDSWHAATGATDNAIGSAVMMEAVRILAALDVRPRRTIRLALWSGEEQGLLGSRAYVAEHFGTAENPKAAYAGFGGYLNVDSGTGQIRAATIFGPDAAQAVLDEMLAPFADLGVVGARSTRSRRRGGSDHTSFNAAGLPGIGFSLDPIEYRSHTWHTNLDTFERIVPGDAMKSAAIVAATAYQLAMRNTLLPRFAADAMPEPRDVSPAGRTQP